MTKLQTDQSNALWLADENGFLDGQEHAVNRYRDELDDLKPIIHHKSYTEGYLAGHAAAHAFAVSVSPVTSVTHHARSAIAEVAVPAYVDVDLVAERARQRGEQPPAQTGGKEEEQIGTRATGA